MRLWIMILGTSIFLWLASFIFINFKITKLLNSKWQKKKRIITSFLLTSCFTISLSIFIDLINAIICTFYLAIIWIICDLICAIIKKLFHLKYKYDYASISAIILTIIYFSIGWYLNHNVWITKYDLNSEKNIKNLRVIMFADAHIGTTFDGTDFAKHIESMQKSNPDIVFVVGDYVDDATTKKDMIEATKNLGKLKSKYGTYFVLGNHDKGYYGSKYRGFSKKDLMNELKKNKIYILEDEIKLINDNFYIIGRKDASEHEEKRKTIKELIKDIDKKKYMIVLDHQPTDFKNLSSAKIDLVLSGHTHGGQLFPFNKIGEWIGANDGTYGKERNDSTNFIITSGISNWEIKFKTGTKSEFVIIDINKNLK